MASLTFELQETSKPCLDETEEPPFELPSFSELHDLFRPPKFISYPQFDLRSSQNKIISEKFDLPSWQISCIDEEEEVPTLPVLPPEDVRESAHRLLSNISSKSLMEAGTAEQQDIDAKIHPEKLVGHWIIIRGIGLARVLGYVRVNKIDRMKQDSVHIIELAEETNQQNRRKMRCVLRRRKLGYWNNGLRFIVADEDGIPLRQTAAAAEEDDESEGENEVVAVKEEVASSDLITRLRRFTTLGQTEQKSPQPPAPVDRSLSFDGRVGKSNIGSSNTSFSDSFASLGQFMSGGSQSFGSAASDLAKSGWLRLERQQRPSSFNSRNNAGQHPVVPRYFSLVFPIGKKPRIGQLMYSKQPNKVPKDDASHSLSLTSAELVILDSSDPTRFVVGRWTLLGSDPDETAEWVQAIRSAISDYTKEHAASTLDSMFAGSASGKGLAAKGGVRRASIMTPANLPGAGTTTNTH